MIRPYPRLSIDSPKTWQPRSVPLRLVSRMSSHSCSLTVKVGVRFVVPAQLTRISTLPNSARTASRSATRDARSLTSEVRRSALRPLDSISAAVVSTCSARRAEATMSAPASASPSEIARPMPVVPPTTTAVFPVRSKSDPAIQFPASNAPVAQFLPPQPGLSKRYSKRYSLHRALPHSHVCRAAAAK
jgi:hypothetical protein